MLKRYHYIQKVSLEEAYWQRARKFADSVVPTVDYRDSHQGIKPKVWKDHLVSKLGEEAVREVLQYFGFQVKGPDYQIYQGKQKSWEADLFVGDIPLGVKTQSRSAAERYSTSWTFQAGKKRFDPILKQPEHWVCFAVVDLKKIPIPAWVFPCFQVSELPFSFPKLKHLRDEKRVVYARDLPLLSREVRKLEDG